MIYEHFRQLWRHFFIRIHTLTEKLITNYGVHQTAAKLLTHYTYISILFQDKRNFLFAYCSQQNLCNLCQYLQVASKNVTSFSSDSKNGFISVNKARLGHISFVQYTGVNN